MCVNYTLLEMKQIYKFGPVFQTGLWYPEQPTEGG